MPQTHSFPLLVINALVSAPALMRSTPPCCSTSRGRGIRVSSKTSDDAEPSPSWPSVLQPVPQTWPSSARASSWVRVGRSISREGERERETHLSRRGGARSRPRSGGWARALAVGAQLRPSGASAVEALHALGERRRAGRAPGALVGRGRGCPSRRAWYCLHVVSSGGRRRGSSR